MPIDTTPDPRDMDRMPESKRIPQATREDATNVAPDISRRPGLPERPAILAADLEDEDEDPVTDSGPGIVDGPEGNSR